MVDLDIRLSVAGDLAVDVEAEGAAADFDMVLGYDMGGGGADLQAKSVTYTPTTAEQTDTVHADLGYDGLSSVNVTVGAMPAGTAGTPTAAKGAVSGHSVAVTPSVTNSAGYIAGGTETGAPVTVSAAELVDGTLSITANGPYDVTNYAGATVSVSAPTPALQSKNATPTEQQQTVTADSGYDGLSSVTVGAIDAGYVGSGVTRRTSSSLTASGATVTAPAGYYEQAASKAVASGTAGTPSASKGTVSNHSVSVTPSVTNSTGYITGGTKTGTAVTVSAGELVSGDKPITANGTGIDVANYATVSVAVPSGQPNLQTKAVTYTPSETQQTAAVTADSGYDGLDEVDVTVEAVSSTYVGSDITRRSSSDLTASGATVSAPAGYYASAASKSVASGSATPAASISATGASVSTGNNTLTLSKTVSNTPQVSAGYIGSGTAGNSSVSLTASVTTKAAATITPSTSAQTIAAGTYLTGAQTIAAMPAGTAGTPTASKGAVSNHSVSVTPSVTNTTGYITGGTKTGTAVTVSASELVSGSETKTANGTYDVTNLAELVVNVSGGGGDDRLTLLSTADMGTIETSSTSAANTGVTLTAQGIDDYDLLIVEAACTKTNGRHLATYSLVYLYNTSNLSSRTAAVVANAKLNYKVTSAGVVTSRGATSNYGGVYVQSCSIAASGSTHSATMTIYKKYTSNDTNTLNGTYTGKIYGIKLHELLGL